VADRVRATIQREQKKKIVRTEDEAERPARRWRTATASEAGRGMSERVARRKAGQDDIRADGRRRRRKDG